MNEKLYKAIQKYIEENEDVNAIDLRNFIYSEFGNISILEVEEVLDKIKKDKNRKRDDNNG